MISKLLRIAALAALVLAPAAALKASPIFGEISFSGGASLDGSNFSDSTAFTSFSGIEVDSSNGIFSGLVAGTPINMEPFSWTAFPASGLSPLWYEAGNPSNRFNLFYLNVDGVTDNSLNLSGGGTAYIEGVGYKGDWILTANGLGSTFNFSSTTQAVPDGGATAALLGLGLIGVAAASRRFRKAA